MSNMCASVAFTGKLTGLRVYNLAWPQCFCRRERERAFPLLFLLSPEMSVAPPHWNLIKSLVESLPFYRSEAVNKLKKKNDKILNLLTKWIHASTVRQLNVSWMLFLVNFLIYSGEKLTQQHFKLHEQRQQHWEQSNWWGCFFVFFTPLFLSRALRSLWKYLVCDYFDSRVVL